MIGRLPGRKADQAADHREDVLDPVAQLAAEDLDLLGLAFGVVYVGACADPADDPAIGVAHGRCPAEDPPVLAAAMAEAIFDLVGFAGRQASPPQLPGAITVG